jgi:SAM-dependent methyltransferase
LANAFVHKDDLVHPQTIYPLDVFFCASCTHLQLLDVVDPLVLYKHYLYVSGTSPVFVRHFQEYARYVIERFSPPPRGLVVEIGCNDGTLLHCFKQNGLLVLGVDPAEEITQRTVASGIDVVNDFFTPRIASEIRAKHGPADIVVANNVIAHIDDISAVMEGVHTLLARNGVFVFEVSYLVDVFEKTLFDTIYHEHIDYHSVQPLVNFFRRHGLELIETKRVDSHGGSLRGVVQHVGGPHKVGDCVAEAVEHEHKLGLDKAQTFRLFADHIEVIKRDLTTLLRRLKHDGMRIAGFGAPAKTTTLMYHLGFRPGIIDFIVDDSPLKQGLYTPGMHIPVVSSDQLYAQRPDYVVILAWNFAVPIMQKHAKYLENGGHFIIPLPKVNVV